VAAGAIAAKLLKEMGITVNAYIKSIGPTKTAEEMENYLEQCMKEHNSAGGVIECVIKGMPAGIGEPCFDKLSAKLGNAILSIGAVKGFEIGDGFAVAESTGLTNNDSFYYNNEGKIEKKTNHAGGILGGLSDGSEIVFRAAIKPTPSIFAEQETVNKSGENISVNIKGRHDPVIVPRAVVVVECMAAITILDALLMNMSAKVDNLKLFYGV
jgi:chorismate synthase